jgi:SAM-dependent methyltransferase
MPASRNRRPGGRAADRSSDAGTSGALKRSVLATGELTAIDRYYQTVAPFYPAEMRLRDDLADWKALARRLGPRRILDLGCGSGRVALALIDDDPQREVVGLDLSTALLGDAPPPFAFVRADMRDIPIDEEFDLIVAANDPFAHLLDDAGRRAAIAEARRLLAPDGLLVIDGLYLPPQDEAVARAPEGLVRERLLDDGTRVRELWHAAGGHRYQTRYTYERGGQSVAEATALVRAWHPGEEALRESGARIAGGLDERDFDPWGQRLVAVVPGWS